MEWNDSAIVLQVGRFRETDLWLKLFFRNRGLVTAFAFGGSRSRRRFCGCLDVLNTISCRVKSGRQGKYLTLEEGVLVRGPQKLRGEWTHFGMLMNCVRFLDALPMAYDACVQTHSHDTNDAHHAEKNAAAPATYALMQDMLSLMEGTSPHTDTTNPRGNCEKALSPHPLHPVLFRLRMACELGFSPAWQECAVCGSVLEHHNILFKMDEGVCVCGRCAPRTNSPYSLTLSAPALHFLRAVQHTSPTQWDVHALSTKDKQACFQAVDGFTQFHLGIAWDAGRFKRV